MARPVPHLASGWSIASERKVYATKRAAYYAIAKRLVMEKYPPAISLPEPPLPEGWTDQRLYARATKADELFFVDGEWSREFSPERWTAFVRRVAKFLAFVDARRGAEPSLPLDAKLQKEYELAERTATEWMKRAAQLKSAIDERARKAA